MLPKPVAHPARRFAGGSGALVVRVLVRFLQRLAIFGIGAVSIWLIAFVVFDFAEQQLPWILALSATYAVGAYIVLPYAVRMGLKVLQHERVPRFTTTADGLPGDPVNLALIGSLEDLRSAFARAGWTQADTLSLKSAWGMARAFVFDKPYPAAPFSTLYLFGRGQDIGFQKPIGDSPRKRHHVRFWAQRLEHVEAEVTSADFWLNTDRPQSEGRLMWVGAATKDTGLSLTRLTFQITHATDSDTNAERDYLIEVLKEAGAVRSATLFRAGDHVTPVNHYVTDGEVAVAELS
jgi:LssY-like putative type I secretion system component LssY